MQLILRVFLFVCAFCFVVLVAEEVHPLGFRLILDKRWRCPFFQLAALVDVIAAPQRNLAAFQSQPLTVTLLHAYGFAHHAPGRVSMPQGSDFNVQWDDSPSRTTALPFQFVVLGLLSDV